MVVITKNRRKKSKLLVTRKTSKKTKGGTRKVFNKRRVSKTGVKKTRTSKKKHVAKSTKKSRKLSSRKKRKHGKKVSKLRGKKKGGSRKKRTLKKIQKGGNKFKKIEQQINEYKTQLRTHKISYNKILSTGGQSGFQEYTQTGDYLLGFNNDLTSISTEILNNFQSYLSNEERKTLQDLQTLKISYQYPKPVQLDISTLQYYTNHLQKKITDNLNKLDKIMDNIYYKRKQPPQQQQPPLQQQYISNEKTDKIPVDECFQDAIINSFNINTINEIFNFDEQISIEQLLINGNLTNLHPQIYNCQELGKGQFGVVYLIELNDGPKFTIKISLEKELEELNIIHDLPTSCKNLLPIARFGNGSIIMLYADTKINDIKLDNKTILKIINILAETLTQLHQRPNNLYYWDIKSENIVYRCIDGETIEIFLSDLGSIFYYDKMNRRASSSYNFSTQYIPYDYYKNGRVNPDYNNDITKIYSWLLSRLGIELKILTDIGLDDPTFKKYDDHITNLKKEAIQSGSYMDSIQNLGNLNLGNLQYLYTVMSKPFYKNIPNFKQFKKHIKNL
jgi:hypothetical protein